MNWILTILVVLITFCVMEGVAWLAHKYLMHGFLWFLHEDHHLPTFKKTGGFFEKNDWFFVIFAFPSMILYITGAIFANPYLFASAIGITLYGFAYFVFHEVVFHERLLWFSKWRNTYIRALRRAHGAHHKHHVRENGECFGLLYFPFKYLKTEMDRSKNIQK
ncbi:MAG: sterol desaturase family protein [Bacteroidales bacterium]